jgi:hypothetical protein
MIPSRIPILHLAMLFAILCCRAVFAEQPETGIVKIEGATQYEITNLEDEFKIRVPLTLQAGVKGVTPSMVSVGLGKRNDDALRQLFKPEMEASATNDSTTAVLLIKASPKQLEQGTYTLVINLTSTGTEVPPKHQFVKFDISLPEAKLAPFEPVEIEQELYFFDWLKRFCGWLKPGGDPTLPLTEISGHKTRLNDIRINQTEIEVGTNEPTHQVVTFAPVPGIAPTDTARSAISLSGPFPLGKTKGKALITSPQLSAPIPISFEVNAHWWKGFIIPIITLGLILGFVARVWAKQRIELQEARLKALGVLQTLKEEEGRHPDAEFRKPLAKAITTLQAAIKTVTATDALSNAVKAANDALTTALQDLDKRRSLAQSDLDVMRKLSRLSADLPAEVAAAVNIDTKFLDTVGHDIEVDNVFDAQTALNQRFSDIAAAVSQRIQPWRDRTKSLLDQASGLAGFLDAAFSNDIAQENSNIQATLDGLQLTIDDPANRQTLQTVLGSVRDVEVRIGGLVNRLIALFNSSMGVLRSQFGANAAQFAPLFKSADQLPQLLLDSIKNSDDQLQELQNALTSAKQEWRQVLLNALQANDAATTAQRTSVSSLLDQNQFWQAAQSVTQFLKTHPVEDQVLGEEVDQAAIAQPILVLGSSPAFTDLTPEVVATFTTVREKTVPPTVESLTVRTMRELFLAKAVRWAIASVGIVLIGYLLFADKFVGTLADVMAVFVWAFGTDISVDALLDAGKKLR